MSLAHEEPFGGHFGEEKTRERIKLSSVWPKMKREIDKFCKSCEKCQLKGRSLVMDRVPITPIPRENTAFRRMAMNMVGPIEPTSAAGHQYCLCIVDSCTRWPAVYLLKSLTAKAVCEELKNLFLDVGVPSVITSDLLLLVLCLLGRFKCLTSPFLSLLSLFFQLSISIHHHPVQHHLSWSSS